MKRFLCFTYLILCCHIGACEEGEVDCDGAPVNKENLSFDLYYDAGTDASDEDTVDMVLAQLCPNKQLIDFEGRVTITFKPGADVYWDQGILACYSSFNLSCTMSLIHACAQRYLSAENFIQFVCCSVYEPAKATIQCAVNLGANETKMHKCIYEVDSKGHLGAIDILTGNTIDLGLKTTHVTVDIYPATLFEGSYTRCLALQSRYFLIHTMCKQLADPKPQLCTGDQNDEFLLPIPSSDPLIFEEDKIPSDPSSDLQIVLKDN